MPTRRLSCAVLLTASPLLEGRPCAPPFGEGSHFITIELRFLAHREMGNWAQYTSPSHPAFRLSLCQLFPGQVKPHCLEIMHPLLAQEQGYPITGQSKASGESHETDRETYLACE